MAQVTQEQVDFIPVCIKLVTKKEVQDLHDIIEEASDMDIGDDATVMAEGINKMLKHILKL